MCVTVGGHCDNSLDGIGPPFVGAQHKNIFPIAQGFYHKDFIIFQLQHYLPVNSIPRKKIQNSFLCQVMCIFFLNQTIEFLIIIKLCIHFPNYIIFSKKNNIMSLILSLE